MAEAILDALGPVLTRWTMGASALSNAPDAWASAVAGDAAEAELRLLALSSQYLGMAVAAEPQGLLRTLADLPALALPTLSPTLRPLAQRVLRAAQGPARSALPHFLAARGWTLHPADWMPSANDDEAPEVYSPWRDWTVAASGEARTAGAPRELTADNWEDYWPAERKTALAELRARDPAAARAVLEVKLAAESADARLRLLEVIATGLSDADAPFLEALAASDRAPKVKALAASFLARLGHGDFDGEDVVELAGFFSVQTKGLLRRARVIEFLNQKTGAQVQRRGMLFGQVEFGAFAAALGFDQDALIEAWPWEADRNADGALLGMIARSASDPLVVRTVERVVQRDGIGIGGLAMLAPRLTSAQRAWAAALLLQSNHAHFTAALDIAHGRARIDDPLALPAGKRLVAMLTRAEARPGDGADELAAIGLLASRTGAERTLERLTRAGMLHADPRLDMLRLNAALEDKGETG